MCFLCVFCRGDPAHPVRASRPVATAAAAPAAVAGWVEEEEAAAAATAATGAHFVVRQSRPGAGTWARMTAWCTVNTCPPRHAAGPATNPPLPRSGHGLTLTTPQYTPYTLYRSTPAVSLQRPNLVPHPHHKHPQTPQKISPSQKGTLRSLHPLRDATCPALNLSAWLQSPCPAAQSPSRPRLEPSAGESSPK